MLNSLYHEAMVLKSIRDELNIVLGLMLTHVDSEKCIHNKAVTGIIPQEKREGYISLSV